MKDTPLTQIHAALGAKIVPFAGYNMPLVYTSIKEEHHQVRNAAGMFDVSHMGEFIIKGKEAENLVQYVTSNDVSKLNPGQAQYSCLPNDQGGIVDDLIVYRLFQDQCSEGEQAYMLVVNASNIDKDWNWIKEHNSYDCKMINISDQTGLLAIQGPKVLDLLQSLTDVNLKEIPFYNFTKGTFAGIHNVLISATGYTGSGGLELYVRTDQVAQLWDAIINLSDDIKPIGLGARDTLRLEMGYCLYGNDIDDQTSPIEAGLGWITKTKIEDDFISKAHFAQQRKDGITKKLVAFKVTDRRVPRKDYPILNTDEIIIGNVTSGTLSPTLESPIGMGYIHKSEAIIGSVILIDIGRKKIKATVCKAPFVKIS